MMQGSIPTALSWPRECCICLPQSGFQLFWLRSGVGLQAYTAEAWDVVYKCDELEASAGVALCSAEAIQVCCTWSDSQLHLTAG